jgi:hypothetical protein
MVVKKFKKLARERGTTRGKPPKKEKPAAEPVIG